jgi:hypothetical protein
MMNWARTESVYPLLAKLINYSWPSMITENTDLSKQRHGWSNFRLKCIIHTCLMINYTYLPIRVIWSFYLFIYLKLLLSLKIMKNRRHCHFKPNLCTSCISRIFQLRNLDKACASLMFSWFFSLQCRIYIYIEWIFYFLLWFRLCPNLQLCKIIC